MFQGAWPQVNSYGDILINPDEKITYFLCSDSYSKEKSLLNIKNFVDLEKYWQACGKWYDDYSITYDDFKKFSFKNGFNTGDIIVLFGRSAQKIKVGDVIVFQSSRPDPIIHRVVKKWSEGNEIFFQTKGDHNPDSAATEMKISQENVIGVAVFRIPFLGYIKIWFVDILRMLGIYKYIPI